MVLIGGVNLLLTLPSSREVQGVGNLGRIPMAPKPSGGQPSKNEWSLEMQTCKISKHATPVERSSAVSTWGFKMLFGLQSWWTNGVSVQYQGRGISRYPTGLDLPIPRGWIIKSGSSLSYCRRLLHQNLFAGAAFFPSPTYSSTALLC
jgi:hypothetical protein